MSNMPMKLLLRFGAILLCAIPIACATPEPPKTVSDVSCAAYSRISYAQLTPAQRALPADQQIDLGNKADSDMTVAEIQAHNARHNAICGAVQPQ